MPACDYSSFWRWNTLLFCRHSLTVGFFSGWHNKNCFLNTTDRIIFIIEMNLVSKYLLMMCVLFVINSSLLIQSLFGCWRKLSLASCSKSLFNPFKPSCYTVACISPGLTLKYSIFFYTVCLRCLRESHNRQPLFPYTTFANGFF
jgi:hypothetical protein